MYAVICGNILSIMIQSISNILLIIYMGALKSRGSRGFGNQLSHIFNDSSTNSIAGHQSIIETAYRKWQSSAKSPSDLIDYITSQQCRNEKYEKIYILISSVTNRQKLYSYLNELQKFILGIDEQNKSNQNLKLISNKIDDKSRNQLLNYIHPKLSNIWFVWSQLSSSHLTAAMVHEKILPQFIHIKDYGFKLQVLYSANTIAPVLMMGAHNNNAFIDSSIIIKQAVRTNYPFLVNKETLTTFFGHIIQNQVFIDDISHFCQFIQAILQQIGTKQGISQCKDYVERLYLARSNQHQHYQTIRQYLENLHKQNCQNYKIYGQLIQSGKKFLEIGYPHAMQLIYQTILDNKQAYQLQQHQIQLYLYTQIYSIFIYNFNQINLQYKHLQKMTIGNIIHLMLRNNNIELLLKLKEVYTKISTLYERTHMKYKQKQGERMNKYSFEHELIDYIFSNYCNLLTCLQIILSPYNLIHIDNNHQHTQYRLMLKLNQSKFQVIIENQSNIKNVIDSCLAKNQVFRQVAQKIEQILQIIRLLYMFGVNQKFGVVTIFYCPQLELYFNKDNIANNPNSNSRLEYIQQQRALQLFKTFVSKYFISGDKNKKIMLNSRCQNPISIDISKAQAILQISQYLYDKILKNSLSSIKDIHQIIFQHMIYFYRYDDARTILTNTSIINKYNINTDMLQVIVINNIIQSIRKAPEVKKIINDVNQQLKMLKNKQSIEVQSVRALVRLVNQLSQHGVQLTTKEKDKIGIDLMYTIIENYSHTIDVLNFDTIYEQIRVINANQIISNDQKFLMTNQLLRFKSKQAAKAYKIGKKNLGNQLVDQISRFNPPWLTTQLIQIFKNSNTKIDKRIYGIALKSCSKGQDLEYLMKLWKQQQSKQKRKEKGFADLTQYFETGREYLVIDDLLIKDQQKFRNYVAECQFNDTILHLKKYELFFVLIGSEPERSFHYALNVGLDPVKIQTFLRQAMKVNIINSFNCIEYLHKYYYFVLKIEKEKLSTKQLPHYVQYMNMKFNRKQLSQKLDILQKNKQKSALQQLYSRIVSAFICSLSINERFINSYFTDNEGSTKNSIIYELLFDEKSRKNLLIGLRQEPMGTSDIVILDKVCSEVLKVNLIQLCIFSLSNLANTSEQLSQKAQNIMQKIVTLSTNNRQECFQIISRLIEKVFSVNRLLQILKYLQSRQNPLYRQIIKQRNIKVVEALAMVEINQELHGIIPNNFFMEQINSSPIHNIPDSHYKAFKRSWSKTNICVLSKVISLIYGINADVQKKIWEDYLQEHPNNGLSEIRLKLQNL